MVEYAGIGLSSRSALPQNTFWSDHTLGWKALWYQKMTLTQSRLCDHNKSNMTFTQSMSYWQILKGGTGLMHKSVLLLWGVCLHRWWSYNEDQMDPLMTFRWLLNLCPPPFFFCSNILPLCQSSRWAHLSRFSQAARSCAEQDLMNNYRPLLSNTAHFSSITTMASMRNTNRMCLLPFRCTVSGSDLCQDVCHLVDAVSLLVMSQQWHWCIWLLSLILGRGEDMQLDRNVRKHQNQEWRPMRGLNRSNSSFLEAFSIQHFSIYLKDALQQFWIFGTKMRHSIF